MNNLVEQLAWALRLIHVLKIGWDGAVMSMTGQFPAGLAKMGVHDSARRAIYVVGCSEKDACRMREVFVKANVANPVVFLSIDDLLPYLKRDTNPICNTTVPAPALILLDLTKSHDSAFSLLRWLHNYFDDLDVVPIVVLTEGADFGEVKRAYQLGARSFLRKPINLTEFTTMLNLSRIEVVSQFECG